jgi:hypothetical protein
MPPLTWLLIPNQLHTIRVHRVTWNELPPVLQLEAMINKNRFVLTSQLPYLFGFVNVLPTYLRVMLCYVMNK